MEQRGILASILSYPTNWVFTLKWLTKEAEIGVNKARAIITSLEAAGYCERKQVRDSLGRLAQTIYVFTDDPPSTGNSVTDRSTPIGDTVDGETAPGHIKETEVPKQTFNKRAAPLPPEPDRTADIENLLKSGLKRGPSPNIDLKLLESARGLGVPVEMIEAGIQGPNVSNPSGLFRSHCARWICGQLPKLHPSIANSALAGRGQHYQTVLNLMTMRQAVR